MNDGQVLTAIFHGEEHTMSQESERMIRDLENIHLTLELTNVQAKIAVYESILAQLPKLLTILGMGNETQQEAAVQLLSTLVDALETFWRDISHDTDETQAVEEDDLGDDFGDDELND